MNHQMIGIIPGEYSNKIMDLLNNVRNDQKEKRLRTPDLKHD